MSVELTIRFNDQTWEPIFSKDEYGNNKLVMESITTGKKLEATGITVEKLGWNEVLINNKTDNQGLYESLFYGMIIRKNPRKELDCGYFTHGIFKLTPVATKLMMEQLNAHCEISKEG